jgi:hypothetical protein
VFGQVKHVRRFRQSPLRGPEKVQGEWAFVCVGHNVLEFCGLCARQMAVSAFPEDVFRTPKRGQWLRGAWWTLEHDEHQRIYPTGVGLRKRAAHQWEVQCHYSDTLLSGRLVRAK